MMLDPSQITSFTHAEEMLRDLIAQWARERRDRGLATYESLPNRTSTIADHLGNFFVPWRRYISSKSL